ncbi:uncharacterized protein LOC142323338 [Lycorma delicatula]|uniref:uncharacterized protein LOC142323338 n=1 Tax=Lycorma delicatula TaxID=130591 RepID=UPI003F51129F
MIQLIWCKLLLVYFIRMGNCDSDASSGADFLQAMMSKIQIERFKSSLGVLANHILMDKSDPHTQDIQPEVKDLLFRIILPDENSSYEFEEPAYPPVHEDADEKPYQQSNLPLSKQELLALYHAALSKGTSLNVSTMPMLTNSNEHDIINPSNQGTLPGYYYYFYPIKSFMNNDTQHQQQQELGDMANMMMQTQGQGMVMPGSPVKRFEPLFIAMASFVGVAMMFILSILFMPKFGNIRSDVAAVKEVTEEGDLSDLSKIVFEAIEGKDCSDRLACELGQAIRVMKLGSKPIRAIEIFLPPNLAKQLALVRKSVNKRERCDFIPCKEKTEKKTKPFVTITSLKKPLVIKSKLSTSPAG